MQTALIINFSIAEITADFIAEHFYERSIQLADENSTSRRQTILIEIANAITHGVGAALAIAGLVILIVRAVHTGSPMRIVTFSIYGAALVLFF